MFDREVTITVDAGDAEAVYKFLRQSTERVRILTHDMDRLTRDRYLDQPNRWDRVAVELGHSIGEVGLKTFEEEEEEKNAQDHN